MIYPNNFENKIGFDKIRAILSNMCLSSLGKEIVESCSFSKDFEYIKLNLSRTHEMIRVLEVEENFPECYLLDTKKELSSIRIDGRWLDEETLFDLKRSLETIINLVRFFCKEDEMENADYPHLFTMSEEIPTFPEIVKIINRILDPTGKLKDNASPELAKIRREISRETASISKTLQAILRNAQSEGIVEKDANPSMRDGRLVIPIAPMHKRKLKGIVHDESATGKTIYIEPVQIVEANNRVRELENDEKREIIKILKNISSEIRPHIKEIIFSYDFLGEIDFLRAKSLFASEISGIAPILVNEQVIDWAQAKHPLLYLSHKKQGKTIVPLDILLDIENRILLISGPNAGGKSVCLKTVGLLQYMVQCGIPIPLAENSKVGIFDNVFIDIGDEQSIEDDLSTYSSHLTNMKFFAKNADNKTLILIDEFGGGTEPQIGGAIAEALLHQFNEKNLFGVITTHYQNLKHFANANTGIINGAMLYDRHLMQPLYALSIGNPGSSFAIEIARKIGLPEEVIQYATDVVGTDYVNMDKYLQDIVRDRRYWETKRQNIRKNEKKLEDLVANYESNIENVNKERKQIIKDAKVEADKLLSDVNAKIENTIRTIKESQADKEKTKQARLELGKVKEKVKEEENDAIKTLKSNKKKLTINSNDLETIEVGSMVRIKGQSTVGEVIEINRKNAVIVFGVIRTNAKIENLERVSKNQIKKETKTNFITSTSGDEMRDKKLNFKQDLDLRGFRGDEALQAVMYFIDDAILVGMHRVRILHGTGTGILKKLIREYLQSNPAVSDFKDEHVDFGGAGITVVDLG